jgi:hypothetical protein
MNHSPRRFRPRLEALEERSLLTVSVYFLPTQQLVIDARYSDANITVHIYNDGAGHITGDVGGDPIGGGAFNGGAGFSNVAWVSVEGGPGGATVNYVQQGDQVYAPFNPPAGGNGVRFDATFEGGNNAFTADFQGHALSAGEMFMSVIGARQGTAVTVNAQGVNIGPGATLAVDAERVDRFAMDYSGIKQGMLTVYASAAGTPGADLSLDAHFSGSSRLPPRPGHGHVRPGTGVAPGDLRLLGGDGNDDFTMYLFSPTGLPLTGDVWGGSGENWCARTGNVTAHNCQHDYLFGTFSRSITKTVTLPHF